jgi:hypothetical protein
MTNAEPLVKQHREGFDAEIRVRLEPEAIGILSILNAQITAAQACTAATGNARRVPGGR